jgi:hypothetical protein
MMFLRVGAPRQCDREHGLAALTSREKIRELILSGTGFPIL